MGKFSSLLQKTAQEGNRFFFVFTEGKYKGGEFAVSRDAQIIIGRDISCDVAIIDAKVSRKHARIWSNNGNTHIEDSNSTNGSLLNGKALKPGEPARLSPGDEITIGDSTFTFTGTKGTDARTEASRPAAPATSAPAATPDPSAPPAAEKPSTERPAAPIPLSKKSDPTAAPAALDAALESLANDDDRSMPRGVNIAKVSLEKRDLKAAMAQTRFDGSLHAKEGKLSKIEPIELLKVLLQASSVGILQVKVTEPFAEKLEIRLGEKGITGATSLTNKLFAEEKALTRFLLAKDGDYHLKESEEPRKENMNQTIFDLFTEISSQKPLLTRYRKIASGKGLRFLIPMTGKLSSLNKKELDTVQFMANAVEVAAYLNMFPEHDDFILLSEILKYIDLGIIFGDNNEEGGLPTPRDIMDV